MDINCNGPFAALFSRKCRLSGILSFLPNTVLLKLLEFLPTKISLKWKPTIKLDIAFLLY